MRSDHGGALGLAIIILFIGSSVILLLTRLEGMRRILLNRENRSIIAGINLDNQRFALENILNESRKFSTLFETTIENSWNGYPVISQLYPFGHFVLYQSLCRTGKIEYKEIGIMANMDFSPEFLKKSSVGGEQIGNFDYSLVQLEPEKSFIISGNSRLQGNMLISPRGIKAGNFRGKSYRLPIPIDGRIEIFREILRLNPAPVRHTRLFLRENNFSQAKISVDKKGRVKLNFQSVKSSELFKEAVREIIGPGIIVLDTPLNARELPLVLRDFIWIYSPDSIVINENINSAYCLFLAEKKIRITGGIHQSQWLAPVIESSVDTLFFPTIVSSLPGEPALTIINSVLQGAIFQYGYHIEKRVKSNQLFLNKSKAIRGVVYCENSMPPEANIRGTLFLGSTYFYQSPTNYYNWITDIRLRPERAYRLFPYQSNGKNSVGVLYVKR